MPKFNNWFGVETSLSSKHRNESTSKLRKQEEEIISIIPYCRTCDLKLKTKEGKSSHKNQGHEVLLMKILKPSPNLKSNHLIMKQQENQPYEIIHGIDYSSSF